MNNRTFETASVSLRNEDSFTKDDAIEIFRRLEEIDYEDLDIKDCGDNGSPPNFCERTTEEVHEEIDYVLDIITRKQ